MSIDQTHNHGDEGLYDTSAAHPVEAPLLAMERALRQSYAEQQQRLAQENEELKTLVRKRDEWATLVAHDLRQPINGIALVSQSLLRRHRAELPDGVAQRIERILTTAHRLHKMVEDLSDVSSLEARRLHVRPCPVDMLALVQGMVDRLAVSCEDHPVVVEVEGPLPPVLADAERVEQALGNLLINAAKYGEAGGRILVRLLARRETEVEVAVSNRGAGIPPQDLPHLFTRFYRGQNGEGGRPGLGLGLYITKGLIEAHGGRIWVESTPGQDTTVSFTLPAAPP